MTARDRRSLVEQRIINDGEIDFSTLAVEFKVSEMTIRRDIDSLESRGVVRRVFGGAIALVGKSTEPPFDARALAAAEVKEHLARAAVQQLSPHETVILDSGSTVLAVARALRGAALGLTVITPSILAVLELVDEPDTTVLLAGGLVRPGELSLIGSETETALANYNCDCYVMGIAGVDAEHGFSEYHRGEGSVKKAAIRSADRLIVVADSSKLARVQLLNVAPLCAAHTIVTDGEPAHPTLVAARNAGVNVVCVPPPPPSQQSPNVSESA